ncbi:MAG TPA: hypothetical protein QF468_12060 [Nitrospinota bacterium]|jgi:hypothetical protein|nr:hypothetical protein [Nitrospinota bacterium]|tara:strand:- start:632 stop:925 length:294 start_codon:yes stop_codon:yes gene_type:complete
MSNSNDILKPDDDFILVFEFLYLSLERYRLSPKDAAKDVFKNFKNSEPPCIQAIKSCLTRDRILNNDDSLLWKESEIREYLEQFLDYYNKIHSGQNL